MNLKSNKAVYNSLLQMFCSKTWFTLYALTIICYLPFIFSFIWGNHDWGWVKEYTPLFSGVFEGRFSQFIIPTILFEGNILPVLTLLLSLAFYCVTAVIFIHLFNNNASNKNFILTGLLLTTAPYTISWLYFNFILLSCLFWTFLIVLAFYLYINCSTTITKIILPTIFFTLSLGGYPPVINMIGVVFFTLIINDICFNEYNLKTIAKKYIPCILSIISAVILVFVTQYILKKYNLQYNTYNTAQISLHTLLPKILICLKSSFTQFIQKTSFIYSSYKYVNLTLFIIAIYNLQKQTKQLYLLFTLLLCMLCASTISLLVAENSIYILNEPRIEFYGILYIYIFSFVIIQKSPSQMCKNISYIIAICTILYNTNTLSYANKVWQNGFDAENKLMERVISRIENNPSFNSSNKYTFIQGGNLNYRSKFYTTTNQEKEDSYTLTAPYIPWHLPTKAYSFYQPTNFFKNSFDTYWSFVNKYEINTTPELLDYLSISSEVWPKPNAIYIDDKTIILTLTNDGKIRATNWVNKHF